MSSIDHAEGFREEYVHQEVVEIETGCLGIIVVYSCILVIKCFGIQLNQLLVRTLMMGIAFVSTDWGFFHWNIPNCLAFLVKIKSIIFNVTWLSSGCSRYY